MGRGTRDGGAQSRGRGKRQKKNLNSFSVHVQTSHDESNHYVLQMCMKKKKYFKSRNNHCCKINMVFPMFPNFLCCNLQASCVVICKFPCNLYFLFSIL